MRQDPSKAIPTSADTGEVWVNWHKNLRQWFDKQESNSHWLRFWNQRAGAGSSADTHDVRSYMERQGVDLTTTFSGSLADGWFGITDWFGDTFNWMRGIIIGGVIVGIALIAFYIYTNTVKGKTAAEMTAGMSLRRRRDIELVRLT